jgi:hypothetical protein
MNKRFQAFKALLVVKEGNDQFPGPTGGARAGTVGNILDDFDEGFVVDGEWGGVEADGLGRDGVWAGGVKGSELEQSCVRQSDWRRLIEGTYAA